MNLQTSELDFDEEIDQGQDELEEIIEKLTAECEQVFENAENSKILDEVFELARANYEKDRQGWNDFFSELKFELIGTDDEDNIHDIAQHYLRKAKLELS
ncbi:MAG: hypothetical protein A3I07_02155 [Candidatus Doudnabacteria bacterium RIFCSPLOWO2_02_FULL_42_9]|uniref:Uncharacterized protein n=1 Tax=Candidatus Doudnabacteria bacterium RIFCSPHIGHO2_01_FULL_41_86 TaxID=1817821 RepID=A0A1F5N890_9BACT|nr:MAG: hypothetical protein A2717_04295 [Candidatus Doudnabacteria bacterium RIFCSPHIGHO2_01_FULL_41_86]OGE75321.1 MAG: hypothetical protein A3K07_00830 [Candidatus Doudnabacteria bacterium RIFCSPHIGHO2_01_43_10]OGE85847.1 MAG: hypothetical protein A3E28_03640 [Candidatus Doudnabacteria bacterium RIFCSPHIGHO2_12_FULL_42_22]OGE87341.1 MAG: hypothetical protein A3C49_01260 [Candidatus Doudnabacteria bacterium RIFCSPHIGHO2_02_FULL_42_25]OGE92179.1 MAG: hypothetical protein A2895_01135 [Candidatus